MDQSPKGAGRSALNDAFHAMFELSRTTPAPTLAERLDRVLGEIRHASKHLKKWMELRRVATALLPWSIRS